MLDVTLAILGQLSALSAPVAVELNDRNIRVDDVATVAGNGDAIIARVPDGTREIELDAATARRLVQNRLPKADFALAFEGAIKLVAPIPDTRMGECFEASQAIASGHVILREMVRPTSCEGSQESALVHYDRDRAAPVAAVAIAPETNLGAIRPTAKRRVAKGDTLALVTGGQGVTITRSVQTMQPGREGRMVFVKTSDGQVFPAPMSHLQDEEDQ